jgi:hypothetical protein
VLALGPSSALAAGPNGRQGARGPALPFGGLFAPPKAHTAEESGEEPGEEDTGAADCDGDNDGEGDENEFDEGCVEEENLPSGGPPTAVCASATAKAVAAQDTSGTCPSSVDDSTPQASHFLSSATKAAFTDALHAATAKFLTASLLHNYVNNLVHGRLGEIQKEFQEEQEARLEMAIYGQILDNDPPDFAFGSVAVPLQRTAPHRNLIPLCATLSSGGHCRRAVLSALNQYISSSQEVASLLEVLAVSSNRAVTALSVKDEAGWQLQRAAVKAYDGLLATAQGSENSAQLVLARLDQKKKLDVHMSSAQVRRTVKAVLHRPSRISIGGLLKAEGVTEAELKEEFAAALNRALKGKRSPIDLLRTLKQVPSTAVPTREYDTMTLTDLGLLVRGLSSQAAPGNPITSAGNKALNTDLQHAFLACSAKRHEYFMAKFASDAATYGGPAAQLLQVAEAPFGAYKAPAGATAPTAAFETPLGSHGVVKNGTTKLSFQDRSTDPDRGKAVCPVWTFGDGTTAAGRHVEHTFAAAGSYTVTETVTDNLGFAKSSTHQTVTIEP